MAQDAPADTAGPSSPPPQLPEGWLPQWEGVQRKWYFVQRATGKSQWEIPTEPVVLTPSTTPGSIGTGPTHPPSRPSTNSPRVTGSGKTLAERIESVVGNARTSSALDTQFNGQLEHPTYGPSGTPSWYSTPASQHIPQNYGQQAAPSKVQYGAQQSYPPNLNTGPAVNHGHIQLSPSQRSVRGDPSNMQWGGTAPATYIHPIHPGGYNPQQPNELPRGFAMDSHYLQSSMTHPGSVATESHLPGLAAVLPTEPQWHPSQQPVLPDAPPESLMGSSVSRSSQSVYAAYPTSRPLGSSPGVFASASSSSNPSLPGSDFALSREGTQSIHNTLPIRPQGDAGNFYPGSGHSMSRTPSQQAGGLSQQEIHGSSSIMQPQHRNQPQLSLAQSQYHPTSMSRTSSGTNFASPGNSAALEPQGSTGPHYQTPLVQAGMSQYQPTPHYSSHSPGNTYSMSASQSYQTGPSPLQQIQWGGQNPGASRTAASDSQFVSGPWASSTPPASGPPQPPR
ncbi:hypothetical protein N7532_004675 [Penicillium argentinense]|uniref:WW domain-containing protein n=1 Tax=Penicillium argentinense TaxID=1131581 RepID=A0A9W9KFR6_9EURO|nr:uncharacterized protein N7532_004675 [Penicillium argentinense]KAJ5104146.1 hypothetical protein N7532_004675 [Penicillium argentinense]